MPITHTIQCHNPLEMATRIVPPTEMPYPDQRFIVLDLGSVAIYLPGRGLECVEAARNLARLLVATADTLEAATPAAPATEVA